MFRWGETLMDEDLSPKSLKNPIYGFCFDRKSSSRGISVVYSEGFSQFQQSLLENKNDTQNIEYNPIDVFNNAKRIYESQKSQVIKKK